MTMYGYGCSLTPFGCSCNGPWYKDGKMIFPERRDDMVPDPVDLQGCEHCSKDFPIEQMTMMVDCWYCAGCYAEWKAHFDACEHEWEPEESEHGEPGRYCHKCAGFQLLEDAAVPAGQSHTMPSKEPPANNPAKGAPAPADIGGQKEGGA